MLLRLLRYNIQVEYVPGKLMLVADALSRAFLTVPDHVTDQLTEDMEVMIHSVAASVPVSQVFMENLKLATARDENLIQLLQFLRNGFPSRGSCLNPELKQFKKIHADVCEINGALYYHGKVIVPFELREKMLQRIHEGHLGIEKSKALARTCMYWPGMASDIEKAISRCSVCKQFCNKQQKETLLPHPVPERPWQKIGTDIFTLFSKDYLLVVDYFSKYPEIQLLQNKTADGIIKSLKSIFARHGIPEEVVSDNMPFGSASFRLFAEEWDFKVTTSSPRYPQSNGMAERSIQTIKRLLKKAETDGTDPYVVLLQYRNAPVSGLEFSPAQMLMSRVLRSKLPLSTALLKPKTVHARKKLCERQFKQKQVYDRKAKDLPPIEPGCVVRVRQEKEWQPAIVKSSYHTPRSFIVQTCRGAMLRRNRRDLRTTEEHPPDIRDGKKWNSELSESTVVTSDDNMLIQSPVRGDEDGMIPNSQFTESGPNQHVMPPMVTTRSGRVVKRPARFAEA